MTQEKSDPEDMYTERSAVYDRFVTVVRYQAGIRSYFRNSTLTDSDLRVLDAGCGTGIVTLAYREAVVRQGKSLGSLWAFDLTQEMLNRFAVKLKLQEIKNITLAKADVLNLNELSDEWTDFDLVLSASMFEYLPRDRLIDGLRALKSRLKPGGKLVLFATRNNWLTRPLIGRWWKANLFEKKELDLALHKAGFATIEFRSFPIHYRMLNLWGFIVEATIEPSLE